ncbi:MAG: opacity protein-like surface antigen [Shewanella sp.]|jgi:opacity protein-like surface antigen
MKSIPKSTYFGVVTPKCLTLCVTYLLLVVTKALYCLLKPVRSRASFPISWVILLGCLLVINSAQAEDISWKQRGYYLQQLAVNDNQLPDESTIHEGLALRVKGKDNQFEIGYTSRSNWQIGFELLTLGGQNALLTEVVSLNSELQDRFTQEVEQYSGWGAKLGYRYVLKGHVSGFIHLGGFNWEQISLNSDNFLRQEEGDQNGISPYLGAGLEYRVSKQASWYLNWQHVKLHNNSFDDVAITLAYRF